MQISATYSPEDNKIRLYASSRLDEETFARVKAAGFKWAPKQELFVAPSWSPARANRIKTLLAELRDLQRDINRAYKALDIWENATTDDQIRHALGWMDSRETMSGWETFSKVEKGELSPADARLKCITNAEAVINGPNRKRCIEHILNRLAYERSMLGDVPRYAGILTPVIIQAFAREHGAEKPKCTVADEGFFLLESPVQLPAHISENSWLELSDDAWRNVMQACGYTVPEPKPRRQSSKPASVTLINPTAEQAAQLQRIWNLHMRAACQKQAYATPKENEVKALPQAVYSRNSKGTYSHFETIEIGEDGRRIEWKWERMERVLSGVPVARIRVYSGGYETHKPRAVVHITDKPAKALPMDLDAIERAALDAISVKESAA